MPKATGGHHHHPVLLEEDVLVLGAIRLSHARVVGQGAVAGLAQGIRELFRGVPGRAIDDAALVPVLVEKGEELALGLLLRLHGEAQVGPVEAVDEQARLFLEEPVHDVAAGGHVGGGGERDGLHVAEAAAHLAQHGVFGAEIMPPLRHAMGLVDGEQVHARARQPLGSGRIGQPLGGGVEDAHLPVSHRVHHAAVLRRVVGGVEASRLDAEMAQGRHLVAHERDERRDHQGEPLPGQGRQLVAQGLARPGGHDRQHVLAGQHRAHDLLLPLAEGGEAEDLVENLNRIDHACRVAEARSKVNAAWGIPAWARAPFAAATPVAKAAWSR
jgi:hypothetical protein